MYINLFCLVLVYGVLVSLKYALDTNTYFGSSNYFNVLPEKRLTATPSKSDHYFNNAMLCWTKTTGEDECEKLPKRLTCQLVLRPVTFDLMNCVVGWWGKESGRITLLASQPALWKAEKGKDSKGTNQITFYWLLEVSQAHSHPSQDDPSLWENPVISRPWKISKTGQSWREVPSGKREAAGWTGMEMEVGQTVAETDTSVPRAEEGCHEGILNAWQAC